MEPRTTASASERVSGPAKRAPRRLSRSSAGDTLERLVVGPLTRSQARCRARLHAIPLAPRLLMDVRQFARHSSSSLMSGCLRREQRPLTAIQCERAHVRFRGTFIGDLPQGTCFSAGWVSARFSTGVSDRGSFGDTKLNSSAYGRSTQTGCELSIMSPKLPRLLPPHNEHDVSRVEDKRNATHSRLQNELVQPRWLFPV